jgi:GDP-4-dehydro-6-deoxy-D-mannose reductase
LLAREYHLDYQVPAVNIRLFNTTGPGKTNDAPSDFVRQLVRIKKGLQRPVIEVGNLKPLRAFLDVSDAVRGFYLAALKGKRGEAYNLCATRTHEVGEMLRTAMRLSGVNAEIKEASRLIRPSDEKIIFGDTGKIRRDTGWKPLRTLDETLTAMLKHWEGAM